MELRFPSSCTYLPFSLTNSTLTGCIGGEPLFNLSTRRMIWMIKGEKMAGFERISSSKYPSILLLSN